MAKDSHLDTGMSKEPYSSEHEDITRIYPKDRERLIKAIENKLRAKKYNLDNPEFKTNELFPE